MEPYKDVEIIQVIRTRLERRGKGVEGDPLRIVDQIWSTTGKLIMENDPYKKPSSQTA